MMKGITYKPIGIIHTPFKDVKDMPIQPMGAKGIPGTINIEPEYVDGIKDLEGFSHIFLIYLTPGTDAQQEAFQTSQ